MVLSNGKTLYISSRLSGPDSKSARMPSELVSAKSASTRLAQPHRGRHQVAELRVAAVGIVARGLGAVAASFVGQGTTRVDLVRLRNVFILS